MFNKIHTWCLVALLWAVVAVPLAYATLPPVTNFAKVQVSTGYDSAATSVVLLSGHGAKLPADFPYPLVWWNCTDFGAPEDDPFVEIVSVTARTGDTLTVIRAHEGTSAATHNTGGKTYCMVLGLTKGMWDAIRTDIAAAGGAASLLSSGTGSPEGVLSKDPGNLYVDTNGGAFATFYIKESGTGNTGWVERSAINWAEPGLIGATSPSGVNTTALVVDQLYTKKVVATYGATVVIDASVAVRHAIIVTDASALLIENPSNSGDWQELSITVENWSGGVMATPTWDTQYKMAAFTKPANGKRRTVTFVKEGSNWFEIFCSPEVPHS